MKTKFEVSKIVVKVANDALVTEEVKNEIEVAKAYRTSGGQVIYLVGYVPTFGFIVVDNYCGCMYEGGERIVKALFDYKTDDLIADVSAGHIFETRINEKVVQEYVNKHMPRFYSERRDYEEKVEE